MTQTSLVMPDVFQNRGLSLPTDTVRPRCGPPRKALCPSVQTSHREGESTDIRGGVHTGL